MPNCKNNQKEKYSLTGILYCAKIDSNCFNHESAYVKRGNNWYNTDYETNKKRFPSNPFLFPEESSFFAALKDNNKEEVIFNTKRHENKMSINLLFYQKVK